MAGLVLILVVAPRAAGKHNDRWNPGFYPQEPKWSWLLNGNPKTGKAL